MPDAPKSCVWITGASTGLGRALAVRLASEGAQVVVSARSADKLHAVARESDGLQGRIIALPLDVTRIDDVGAAVERIEATVAPISLAVLNAGTHSPDSIEGFRAGNVQRILDLNVMGVVNALEALLPRMSTRHGGHLAIVASLAGYRGLPYAAGYGASKAALINLAESLRPELARAGIKLQIVNPGFVKTPLTDRNTFPMPFLMELDAAAAALANGLASNRFEVVFPRRFAIILKLLRILPDSAYFALTRRLLNEPRR